MSAERPRIDAGLAADLLGAAPGRVRRKLDADPRVAETWEWRADDDGWSVAAGGETVRLAAPVLTEAAQVGCSCLLSPRCLHLLAAVGVLDSAGEGEPAAGEPTGEPAGTGPVDSGPETGSGALLDLAAPVDIDDAAGEAALLAWSAGAEVLTTGVRAAGAPHRAGLLRAASVARAARLPRLAAACTTVAAGVRDAATPAFTLPGYTEALGDLLGLAWRLGGGPEGPRPAAVLADVGVGRRSYAEIGTLRLYGLACERVATGSGYAGVVSHVLASGAGGQRALWRIGDVAPGGAERVTAAYRGPVGFGGVSLSHRDLARSGMVAQRVSASADGRLSGGTATTAATSGGATWWDPPLSALWEEPFADQVARALAALSAPVHRTGADLVFADLTVVGPGDSPGEDGSLLATEVGTGRTVLAVAAGPDDRVGAANLVRLAADHGAALRVVARPLPGRPGALHLLAAAPDASRPLPESWAGRINLGLDALPGRPPGHPRTPVADGARRDPESPLAPCTRVLNRLAEGGRCAASAAAVDAAVPRLRRTHLPGAADLLTELGAAAGERLRTATGESVPPPPDRLALTWLAALAYASAAAADLDRRAWIGATSGRSSRHRGPY